MDEIRIGYFLEDIGHQTFLEALVERIAREMAMPHARLRAEVRNATGGRGQVFQELRDFLRDVSRERERPFDLLVVAIDGNCRGYRQTRDDILDVATQSDYAGPIACAVPNPHIERWYLADPLALQQVLEVDHVPDAPRYKCERARYKQVLRETIRQAGVVAPLGGLEYGADIVASLDLYTAGKADTGFKHLLDALGEGLAPFAREP